MYYIIFVVALPFILCCGALGFLYIGRALLRLARSCWVFNLLKVHFQNCQEKDR